MPQFSGGHFDIGFSNSTIEHVETAKDQQSMAAELQRVGKRYPVQTPNRCFPIEPHFLFPFFQFLPARLRAWLMQHFNLGWHARIPDRQKALEKVTSIHNRLPVIIEPFVPTSVLVEMSVPSLFSYPSTGKPCLEH